MKKEAVQRTVRRGTWLLWILECSKIIFNLFVGNGGNPNTYVPLYFCSLTLYSGLAAGYGKGAVKRCGDVFMLVGGLTGGAVYLLFPSTTAGMYPAFHFITIQSYFHHGMMIYLGMLYLYTSYITLERKDIFHYAGLVTAAALIAYVLNLLWESNLMFVSYNFPGTAIDIVYSVSPALFPLHITLWQAVPPFFLVRAVQRLCIKWAEGRKPAPI